MKTILLVDDEESIRVLYRNEFKERGYRVLTAANGQEALEILRKDASIQLVITDLKHPEPDGRELLRLIKKEWPKLPVIINTSFSSLRDDKIMWEAEAYLVKSPDLGDLFEAVNRVFADHSRS